MPPSDLREFPMTQEQAQKHSPLPWHVGPFYKSDIESQSGRIAECVSLKTPRAEANAEFIVRACNSHHELLAALKLACAAIEPPADDMRCHKGLCSPAQCARCSRAAKIHAALAKAEEATHV